MSAQRVVFLDPGHGAHDPGAIGNGLVEKEWNLKTANIVKRKMEANGHKVIMSRTSDVFVDLSERARMANRAGADIFLSMHFNSAWDPTAKGYEDFKHSTLSGPADDYLQDAVHGEVKKLLASYGLSNRGKKQADFAVLRETKIPALLTEAAFCSNPQDAAVMKSDQFIEDYTTAIANGVQVYFGLPIKEAKKLNHAENPDQEGRSTKFSRGEYVRTVRGKATNFYDGTAIPANFHDQLLIVDWLNADGTISVRVVLDAEGALSEQTYRMYERDLAYTDQNPKQHFSKAANPDKEGRSTMFKVGQKVRTSGKATHYREGEKIEPWLHSQVLTVDYLNADGSITVKPEIDTGARATFKRNLWEWDLTEA